MNNIEKNISIAAKILPAMRAVGQTVIRETADGKSTAKHVSDIIAKHISDIVAWGYNGKIHTHFHEFVTLHIDVAEADSGDDDLIRWAGEILVDFAVLDAARKYTKGEPLFGRTPSARRMEAGDKLTKNDTLSKWEDFIPLLPFEPPPFEIEAKPYTPIADTFFWLSRRRYIRGHQDVIRLADSRNYDDIFHHLLLWKTYYKEPFHCGNNPPYWHARSIDDYHRQRERDRPIEAAALQRHIRDVESRAVEARAAAQQHARDLEARAAADRHWESGDLAREVFTAYQKCADNQGWAHLGAVTNHLNLSPKAYGEKRLIDIVERLGYEIERGKRKNPLIRKKPE